MRSPRPKEDLIVAKQEKGSPDWGLIIVTGFIVAFGMVMIYSASSYYAFEEYQDQNHFLTSTLTWLVLGLGIFAVTTFIPYRLYYKMSWPIILVTIILLIAVYFSPAIRGEHRWITIGNYQFQPSEFSKLSMIVFIAFYLIRFQAAERTTRFERMTLNIAITTLIGIVAALIFFEDNKSTAVVVAAISMGVLFVNGTSILYLLSLMGIGAAGVFAIIFSKGGEALQRLQIFMNPFENILDGGWQPSQGLFAFALGGVRGVGLGASTQNKLYLSDAHNDFILGIIGEEMGLWGVTILMILYVIMIYRCFRISLQAPDRFSSLIAAGVGIMISIHVVLNVAVNTQVVPVTGVTLPLVSYGGSSTLAYLIALGIVLNISRYRGVKHA